MALAGRVPVKVSLENGPIMAGDRLTTASTPGYAMKATKAGPVIGQALENFDGTSTIVAAVEPGVDTATASGQLDPNDPEYAALNQGLGTILVFVSPGWYDPGAGLTTVDNLRLRWDEAHQWIVENTATVVDQVDAYRVLVAARLQAGLVDAQELVANRVEIKSDCWCR